MILASILMWGACRREPTPLAPGACETETDVAPSTQYGIRIQEEGCGELTLLDYRVLGEGDLRVDLFADGRRILPRITSDADGSVFRGLHMEGPFELSGATPLQIWQQGYGTRSSSGVSELGALLLDDDGLPVLDGDRPGSGEGTAGTSWWAGLVARPGGAAVLVGVHGGRSSRFSVGFDAVGRVHALWGSRGEATTLDDGEVLYLDPLFTAMGPDPASLWERWATAVAAGAEVALAPAPEAVWIARDEAELHAFLPEIGARGFGRVRLDAGEEGIADEPVAGDAFPSGTGAAAEAIASAGAVPSLWLAPFRVSPDAAILADHPDWFVRERDGRPLRVEGYAVLDPTRPDAAAWLRARVAGLVAEGWSELALDHLALGAIEGLRAEDRTGTEALAIGLSIVRESGASLVAIDAPWLPVAGQVDVLRVDDASAAAARGFTHGRWGWAEPAPLPPDAGSAARVGAAVTGGAPVVVGAPVDLEGALASGTTGWVSPEDPLRQGVPARWFFEDGRTALLNLGDAPLEVEGPGGEELLTGEVAAPGPRTLLPETGELWR